MTDLERTGSDTNAAHHTSLADKIGAWNVLEMASDAMFTYTTQRMVYTKHRGIGTLFRLLQAGVITYVVYMTLISYKYLEISTAEGIVTGWLEPGAMYTGK